MIQLTTFCFHTRTHLCPFNCPVTKNAPSFDGQTHRGMDLKVDGGELDGLSFGVVEGGVQGVRADGGVEDGGLLAGHGGLVGSRFGQDGHRVLRWLNGGGLQQLARRPLGSWTLMDHKLLLLLLVLLHQGMWLDVRVCWNDKINRFYFMTPVCSQQIYL